MIPISELFGDLQRRHSKFQVDQFITSKHGMTDYGCYKQALRELHTRFFTLAEQLLQREQHVIAADKARLKASRCDDSDDGQLKRRKYESRERAELVAIAAIDLDLTEMWREFGWFYSQSVYFRERVGPLTPERVEQLDLEMWTAVARGYAARDLFAEKRLTPGTIEMLSAFPEPIRGTVTSEAMNPAGIQRLIADYMERPSIADQAPQIDIDPRELFRCYESSLLPSRSPISLPMAAVPSLPSNITSDCGFVNPIPAAGVSAMCAESVVA